MERSQPSRPLSLLLVDDTPLIREEVRNLLEPLTTVRVTGEAADGESGVRMALDLRPDIVIMDVQMPGLNGIDATRQIKKALPRTSVIGFSVQSDSAISRVMHDAGAATLLGKDRATDLPQVIASLVGRHPDDLV